MKKCYLVDVSERDEILYAITVDDLATLYNEDHDDEGGPPARTNSA